MLGIFPRARYLKTRFVIDGLILNTDWLIDRQGAAVLIPSRRTTVSARSLHWMQVNLGKLIPLAVDPSAANQQEESLD